MPRRAPEGTKMRRGGQRQDGAATGFTLCRLLLIPVLLWAVTTSLIAATLAVAAVIAMDVVDGGIARSMGCDTDARRVLDAGIDRLTVHAALVLAVVLQPAFLVLYLLVAGRDAMASAAGIWMIRRRRLLLLGGRAHMAVSLADAAFGLAIVSGVASAVQITGILAVTVNYLFLADYAGSYLCAGSPATDRLRRITIRRLAGLRSLLRFGRRSAGHAALEPQSQLSIEI